MTYNNQSSLCWSVYVSMVLMSVIPTCPQSIPGLDPLWWCLVASMTQWHSLYWHHGSWGPWEHQGHWEQGEDHLHREWQGDLVWLYTTVIVFLGGGRGALEEPAIWHHSPATETKALCSAMPPLVTMRSVYTPSSSLYRLGIVSLVNPLPVSIFTHLESKRRTSGEWDRIYCRRSHKCEKSTLN